jgi:hypothetical protein
MFRHLLRASVVLVVFSASLFCVPSPAVAQGLFGGGGGAGGGGFLSDPFQFYYAFYLPNQQLQAMRPTPMDSINQAMVARQYYAQSDKKGLYNPISPFGADSTYDPLHPYSGQQGKERIVRPYRFVQNPSNQDGSGPSLYYGRAQTYFPSLRLGRGPNANTYAKGSRALSRANQRTGGMGGGGMGGMGGGGMGGMGGMGGGGMGGGGMGGMM